jgi:hypothetical protein
MFKQALEECKQYERLSNHQRESSFELDLSEPTLGRSQALPIPNELGNLPQEINPWQQDFRWSNNLNPYLEQNCTFRNYQAPDYEPVNNISSSGCNSAEMFKQALEESKNLLAQLENRKNLESQEKDLSLEPMNSESYQEDQNEQVEAYLTRVGTLSIQS